MNSEHLVQLFDAPRSLADGAARYLADGWAADERLLVVARPRHWTLIASYLKQRGCTIEEPAAAERCRFIDAEALLRRIRRRGVFNAESARSEFSTALDRVKDETVRVYGELVELLAAEGDYAAACTVEDIWNDLFRARAFNLLCGYLAPHFSDPAVAPALHAICARHTAVRSHPADSLGTWLTAVHTRRN